MADKEIDLPPPEPFVPYATIFKMNRPGEDARKTVSCLDCAATFPLSDIFEGELNEEQCPACGRWALDFWQKTPTQRVPN